MKAPLLLICAGISYGVVQLTNCSPQQPQIKQRLVQVIEIGPNHPPKQYVVLEDVK